MKHFLRAAMVGIWATAAMAHSPLDATTPAHDAVIAEMPAEVLLTFKGEIRLTRVSISQAGAEQVDMDLGQQTTFAQEFALPVQDMGAGTYQVEWRGLGADGHVLKGSFSFTVE
ncbi:copper resistance protein CopC [Sulfitobacter sp. F26204]|uniref:copper resistance CopC family protein n=1 Tax=Sulfitobacter sp. F26204 TaxID=2996014 RepID=UPI00225E595F|nr:copper resistance CopC family protein [Sulfitobacter sp. F26204]MCX7560898.1 copper resistance protein CopC [Sulfitobacter sp. F26204]